MGPWTDRWSAAIPTGILPSDGKATVSRLPARCAFGSLPDTVTVRSREPWTGASRIAAAGGPLELTLDSAFSAGGWVGHLSYLLLVLSMLMRRLGTLRVLAVASAVTGISYDLVWVRDPVGVFWESLLLVVNLGQLALMKWEARRAVFSVEEKALVEQVVPQLSRRLCRKLLDAGVWSDGVRGQVLTREGEAIERLTYLASGEALISLGGVGVAACPAGSLVGEITVLTRDPATGTATLVQPSRMWSIDARVLRSLAEAEPEILSALRAGFANNLREKLVASNHAALEALQRPD